MSKSLQLKEEGNKCFISHDYVGADSLYSKAYVFQSTVTTKSFLLTKSI